MLDAVEPSVICDDVMASVLTVIRPGLVLVPSVKLEPGMETGDVDWPKVKMPAPFARTVRLALVSSANASTMPPVEPPSSRTPCELSTAAMISRWKCVPDELRRYIGHLGERGCGQSRGRPAAGSAIRSPPRPRGCRYPPDVPYQFCQDHGPQLCRNRTLMIWFPVFASSLTGSTRTGTRW